jgi:putative ABC transport system permease protein
MPSFWPDLRYAARALVKNPGYAAVAVLTLALGIGANTALFSVIEGVLLRPLPFSEPQRIVGLREMLADEGVIPMAYRTYVEVRDRGQSFESVSAFVRWGPYLERDDETIQVRGMQVRASYFDVMGLKPLVGRGFRPEDDTPQGQRVVVLSYEYWRQYFGGREGVIGQSLRLDGVPHVVIGVMPPALAGDDIGWAGMWRPIGIEDHRHVTNPGRWVQAVARLKPGVSPEQAEAELSALVESLKREYPEIYRGGHGAKVERLKDVVVARDTQAALWLLFGAVACVLLIACANVANLSLARSAAREREIAVRAALGASRLRLVRQMLVESLLLAFAGALAGLSLAQWGVDALKALNAEMLPRLNEVGLNATVLAFTGGLAVLTGVLFGLAPALGATRLNLNEALKEGRRAAGQGARQGRIRSFLVVAEIAVALVLLVGAGLLIKSFARLRAIDPGFDPAGVLTMHVRLPHYRYREGEQRVNFFREAVGRISRLPGVTSAAAVQSLLLKDTGHTDPVYIEGRPAPPKGQEPVRRQNIVTPDYFRAMGIRVVKGRTFTEEETFGPLKAQGGAIIINESFARKFWPGEDPLGKRMRAGYGNQTWDRAGLDGDLPWSTVVGVVADTVQPGVEHSAMDEMFYPYVNAADPPMWGMNIVVRSAVDPASLANAVRAEIHALDRQLPLNDVRTMNEWAARAVSEPRFNGLLLGLFALVALALASVGVYGVMSYAVTQRRHEIGVRMALGARSGDVLRLVVGRGMKLALVGVACGVAASLALTRVMQGLLYGVSALDAGAFAGAAALLAGVAFCACYLPARRAAKVDPAVALRAE